jgi:parallel beta-helix repeat protein
VDAADNGNVIENNTVVGNTNGIFLVAGVQGNIFRGNLVTGNPALQVSVDNPSNGGVDIKNLASAGANAFEGNICLTSANAPCPSEGVSFSANPNPIPVASNAVVGQTTISWSAPDAQVIEIHIGSPTGPLFTRQGNRGSVQTGPWASDGLTFYLQDVTGGNPLTSDYTLAMLVVNLQTSSAKSATLLRFKGGPR